MKLSEYIKENGGVAPFAAKLGVTGSCVRYWLRGDVKPRIPVAQAIVAATDGKVTLADLRGDTDAA